MDARSPRNMAAEAAASPRAMGSPRANEALALVAKDFSLVNRLLNVRIYQVFHTSVADADGVGFRVAATDEVENDFALFVPRAKAQQLLPDSDGATAEAFARAILAHLDIAGNRHRDVGRLVCRDPEVPVDHKPRVAPRPKSSSKTRNAHLQEQDKRASRNKQSQQRAMDAIAAAHSHHAHHGTEHTEHTEYTHAPAAATTLDHAIKAEDEARKSRKVSEASLLHRMAHKTPAAVYRTDLTSIDDDGGSAAGVAEGEEEEQEDEAEDDARPSSSSSATSTSTYRRALPDRKPKYSALQQRRDKERKQRLMVVRRPESSPPKQHNAPSNRTPAAVAATPSTLGRQRVSAPSAALIHPVAAVVGGARTSEDDEHHDEQEQFLRRRMVAENHNRVFKTEGVFDDAMGVEITHERPDHRFHTPEHAPPSPDPALQKRMSGVDGRRRSGAPSPQKKPARENAARRSLAGSASAPLLPSPRELPPLSPRPEQRVSTSSDHKDEAKVVVTQEAALDKTEDDSRYDESDKQDATEESGETVTPVPPAETPDSAAETPNAATESLDPTAEKPNAADETPSAADETPSAVHEDDAALETINLSDEVAIAASIAGGGEDDDWLVVAPDEPVAAPFADEIGQTTPPRTARRPSVIDIQEDEPTEADEPDAPDTEEETKEEAAPDVLGEEVIDAVADDSVPAVAAVASVPLVSPRVECWEEVNTAQEEIADPAPSPTKVAETEGVEAKPSEPLEEPWASPPEEVATEEAQEPDEQNTPDPKAPQADANLEAATRPAVEPTATSPRTADERAEPPTAAEVEPAEDPVAEELSEEPVSEKPVEDPVAKGPVVDPVVEEPCEDRVDEEPSEDPVFEEPVEDPVVEVERAPSASHLIPAKEQPMVRNDAPGDPPAASPTLKRAVGSGGSGTGVGGGAVVSRRGSILDAATSAIAFAAAAAAVMAAAVPAVEVPRASPTTSPKNESKRKHHKRRSHDATAAAKTLAGDANHTESKRLGPRRSTIHLLHTADKLWQPKGAPTAIAPSPSESAEPATATTTTTPPPHHEEVELAVLTPSSTASVASEADRKPLHPTPHHANRQRSQQEIETLHKSPTYHTKWLKWSNGKQLIDKVSCLQLEEQLLHDPSDVHNLLKLGLRYARWPATSLPAVLLLESATVVQDGAAGHSHEYWNSLGNAHFDVFLRHRKFLPVAIFHLSKALQAFTRAFAYLESVADPLLLLRYAICMYWKRSDGNANLEHADDIFRELFTKFASFCDKDRPNLLFFHFQILCRLRMFNEAIECLNKITAIQEAAGSFSDATPTTAGEPYAGAAPLRGNAPPPYDGSDYLLMLMHCQQASGDFLQASATFTQLLKRLHQLNSDILADGSTLSDQDYLQMWGGLADKCFHHEDYALAIEFYAITVTYAKDSRVLARVLYNHALCYQAIGEGIKCSAEFKRAKNINRHVVPFATLAEIHARYDDQYNSLLRTPVDKIIEDVRQNLYDRAVTSLQRIFRRKKKVESDVASGGVDGAHTLQRSSSGGIRNNGRRQSVVATLTNLVEGSGNRRSSAVSAGAMQDGANKAGAVDPHEAFLKRHTIALQTLETLRGNRQMKKTSSMRMASTKLGLGAQSGLLSPVADRPDLRRKHSMDSLAKRLGYLPENREQFAGYWHNLVTTSLDLYETQTVFNRHVARIRSILPIVSEAVACCALADAMGNVDNALERLHDTTYEQELQLVSTVVDITTILRRHFENPTEKNEWIRFPPIKSPTKVPSTSMRQEHSPSAKNAPLSNLPPCKSPSTSSFKAVRLSSLIDAQFEEAGRERIVNAEDDVGSQRLRDTDKFVVVEDFRAVNASLLHGWQR